MTRPTVARVMLALCLAQTLVIMHLMSTGLTSLPHPAHLGRLLPLDLLLTTPGWSLFSLTYVGLLVAFLVRWREDAVGWALLACLALMVGMEMSIRQIFMPQLEAMLGGGLLTVWLLARAWAHRQGLAGADADHLGHEAAAGAFGAMLSLAAMSKAHLAGLDWFYGPAHCATVFEHEYLTPHSVWSPVRSLLLDHVWMCTFGAVVAFAVEAAGIAMVWPPLRKAYALAVVWLFLSLSVFYGIEEVSWVTLALALAWSHLGERRPQAT